MPRLLNCAVVRNEHKGKDYLLGEVYGDYRFEDGSVIYTSSIVDINFEKLEAITNSGTLYTLENLMSVEKLRAKYRYEGRAYIPFLDVIEGKNEGRW